VSYPSRFLIPPSRNRFPGLHRFYARCSQRAAGDGNVPYDMERRAGTRQTRKPLRDWVAVTRLAQDFGTAAERGESSFHSDRGTEEENRS